MSLASRFFVAASGVWPPMCNQMLMEGLGNIDVALWRDAVQKASDKNPGSRYRLEGVLAGCRWVDTGIDPVVRVVDGSGWDGFGSKGAPFLMDKLDTHHGPTCEVLVVQGNPLRVVFRTHHGVMDGMGTITWVEDIFNALAGRPLAGSRLGVTEDDLLNLTPGTVQPASQNFIPVTGKPVGEKTGLVWKRETITGKYKKLLSQIIHLTAREAWKNSKGNVRIGVPVNLRPRQEGLRSTNNLTTLFFVYVTPDTTIEDIESEIKGRLQGRQDGAYTWEDKIVRYIPITILKSILSYEGKKNHRRNQYRQTGYVSNLGCLPLERFSGGGFVPKTFFFIPPGLESLPFFMTLNGGENHVELILTMPEVLASGGRIDDLLHRIASSVVPA